MGHRIFKETEAIWNFADKKGGEDCPFELATEGSVELVQLDGEDAELSRKSLGDSRAVVLKGGYLRLNCHQAVRYRPENNSISLYVRAKFDKTQAGCFFYSDFISLSHYGGGVICSYLGVKTKNGATFREMPLCMEKESGWKDMILTVGNNAVSFYINGNLKGKFRIEEELCSPFDDDIIIGAFRCCKPDTYSNGDVFATFREMTVDTVALWHKRLSENEISLLSGGNFSEQYEATPIAEATRLHNEYFDASVKEDISKCRKIWDELTEITRNDTARPKWHLTQPYGMIYDPCGAFYHNGRYHVYSYHNICYLLSYSSLDHYASDDLVHWYGMPISPFADSENDVYCIYLLNHFIDDDGNVKTIYTGQGTRGKMGIEADADGNLVSYNNKHAVLKKYHHDGHVFRHDGKWYTITSKLCRGTRENGNGDAVMLWSSEDLENWKEESEIFCRKKDEQDKEGFTEFPYLLNFGEKDVLMMGGRCVTYWVGKFDWESLKFIPDKPDGTLIDKTNTFHCFNPLCVDNKGENGSERRIIMALCIDIHNGGDFVPWNFCHVQPRILSLENDRIRQDVLPELETLRSNPFTRNNLVLHDNDEEKSETVGDSLEIKAVFEAPEHGGAGIKIQAVGNSAEVTVISYNKETDTIAFGGNVLRSATFEAYHERCEQRRGKPIEIRAFIDRRLIEVCVNGQWATSVLNSAPDSVMQPKVYAENECVCREFTVWKMAENT